jgi:hypothetical protein
LSTWVRVPPEELGGGSAAVARLRASGSGGRNAAEARQIARGLDRLREHGPEVEAAAMEHLIEQVAALKPARPSTEAGGWKGA